MTRYGLFRLINKFWSLWDVLSQNEKILKKSFFSEKSSLNYDFLEVWFSGYYIASPVDFIRYI